MSPPISQSESIDDVITVVAQCVGIELLGRELDAQELACIARRVVPLLRSYRGNGETHTKLTPPQVAKMLGVNADKVLRWIRSGELRAINVAARTNGRPRYRIDIEDLCAFERRRSVVDDPPPRRRRKRNDEHIIEFF